MTAESIWIQHHIGFFYIFIETFYEIRVWLKAYHLLEPLGQRSGPLANVGSNIDGIAPLLNISKTVVTLFLLAIAGFLEERGFGVQTIKHPETI